MSETEENKTVPEEVPVSEDTNKEEKAEEKETVPEEKPVADDENKEDADKNEDNEDNNDDEDDGMFDGSDNGSDSDSGTEKKRRSNKILDDDDDDEEEDDKKKEENKIKRDDSDPFSIGDKISNSLGYKEKKEGEAEDFIEDDMKPKKKRRKTEKAPRKKKAKGELKEDEYDESGESISTDTGRSSRSKKDKDAMIEERARRIIDVMEEAFDDDVTCVKAHKIPFNMINKMEEVQEVLSNSKYYKALESKGIYFPLAKWLKPLKGPLPLAETRGKILNLALEIVKAADVAEASFDAFKDSELTARVYYLYKNDTNPENRKLAKKFIDYVSVAVINRN